MSNLSDIKRRLQSVKQTRQITGAMETVSVAKLRKAVELYENSRAYINAVTDIMTGLVESLGENSELLMPPAVGKDILIVLSSDRGLCGGFDQDIVKAAKPHIGENTVIMPIGQSAAAIFGKTANADLRFSDFYSPDHKFVQKIAAEIIHMYGNGVKSVSIAYAEFVSNSYRAVVKQLLPISVQETNKSKADVGCFEPSAEDVYTELLPLYVSGALYGALINNSAAEQSARHAAMSAATESADGLIASLSLEYNRARQSSVTEQIVEIVGATTALEKRSLL